MMMMMPSDADHALVYRGQFDSSRPGNDVPVSGDDLRAACDALLNGTGAGQPLGILNSNALVSVAKESGQDAATILAENIEKMYARALDPAKCEWYINQACWTQIFQLHQLQ